MFARGCGKEVRRRKHGTRGNSGNRGRAGYILDAVHNLVTMAYTDQQPTHVAYADESFHNTGRYRSIAIVTLSIVDSRNANKTLQCTMRKSGVGEFKWSKLKSARNRFAALKLLDHVIEWVMKGGLRVDTLTWDIEDSRHSIAQRSDIRNLRRMYYFLFRNVLARRWPGDCVWELRPDETSFRASSHLGYLGNPDELNEDTSRVKVCRVIEVNSDQEPLVQIADFFAGIACYSRTSYASYEKWSRASLGSQNNVAVDISNSDRERCQVLDYLYRRCKDHKLGVSLESARGLRTRDPRRPINFWWYEPQGSYDKAPIWH